MNIEQMAGLLSGIVYANKRVEHYDKLITNPNKFLSEAGITFAKKQKAHYKLLMDTRKAELRELLK